MRPAFVRPAREDYVRPVTGAAEAPSTWRTIWPIRLLGLAALALLIYLLVLLLINLRVAGG